MSLLNGSVGKNGDNLKSDVKKVQQLLNKHPMPPLVDLSVDGIAGNNTIASISEFQIRFVKMKNPDGRVDPGGKTIRYLNRGQEPSGQSMSSSPSAKPNDPRLSGSAWWKANQAKYPNRRGLEYLDGDFKEKTANFVKALKEGGAKVSIGSTRRNKIRAHLMHYSWKVSKGMIKPSDVPAIKGLDIIWDHGNDKNSRKAAGEMVRLFNLAYMASLTSNHIKGKAIDMTVSWKGQLTLKLPTSGNSVTIKSGPRTGAGNRELHRIGRDSFGVVKLVKDPPHWSYNGR